MKYNAKPRGGWQFRDTHAPEDESPGGHVGGGWPENGPETGALRWHHTLA
jgi:hypothetical protein